MGPEKEKIREGLKYSDINTKVFSEETFIVKTIVMSLGPPCCISAHRLHVWKGMVERESGKDRVLEEAK